MSINKIGVIGAGLIGNGIAHASIVAGYDVVLVDAFEAALPKAIATMTKNMYRQVAKNTLTAAGKDDAPGCCRWRDLAPGSHRSACCRS
jgi:3-hydroxybutyryl-CoA dehydrogenase